MRRGAYALLSACIIAAIALAGYLGLTLNHRHLTGWVAAQDIPAGTALTGGLVHEVSVPEGADDFTVLTSSPVGKVLSVSASRGDLLRPDDVLSAAMAALPISFKLAPSLSGGDCVDIYGPAAATTPFTGSSSTGPGGAPGPVGSIPQMWLVGRGITVLSAGSPMVISVPARLEAAWVSLIASGTPLVAARSCGLQVPSSQALSAPDAASVLHDIAAQPTGPAAAASQAAGG
jgi:hypothetical protein